MKKIDETSLDDDQPDENLDSIPFTQEELRESPKLQITEKALIHDLPKYDRIQTRSQTRNKNIRQETSPDKLQEYADKIEEIEEDRHDPPDKESNIEDDKSIASKKDLNIKNDENQMLQMKPTITDIQHLKVT